MIWPFDRKRMRATSQSQSLSLSLSASAEWLSTFMSCILNLPGDRLLESPLYLAMRSGSALEVDRERERETGRGKWIRLAGPTPSHLDGE